MPVAIVVSCLVILVGGVVAFADQPPEFPSHPPMRSLPVAAPRPLADGPVYFVDATNGSDSNPGTQPAPFQSIQHGISVLKPGDTLCLRGGTYYERLSVTLTGETDRPITIRAYPNELVVIDGGYREFFEQPVESWEPVDSGVSGEFRSSRKYPGLAAEPDSRRPVFGSGAFSSTVKVLGNFGDSMVPLHGYAMAVDLRNDNLYWNIGDKLNEDQGIYCGPGIWYDEQTQRIHFRAAHTNLDYFDANYQGETDPRRLPLVIGGPRVVLDVEGAAHLRFQDLVFRGSRGRTISVINGQDIELENVTAYGGCPAMWLESSRHVRISRSAFRGVSAPWSTRSSEKYRGISTYLFISSFHPPLNQHIEIDHCEFTDCHDGVIVGTIDHGRFHHNLVENFNDDGLYLTIFGKPGKEVHIFQNLIRRCGIYFSFAGDGENQQDTRAFVYRNVIDMRPSVQNSPPTAAGRPPNLVYGQLLGDHGSPIWKPINFYHNTVIVPRPVWRDHYGAGMGRAVARTHRRVFNNIFCFIEGMPGFNFNFVPDTGDTIVDGNLFWSYNPGPAPPVDVIQAALNSANAKRYGWFEQSKQTYPPGWMAHDQFADPQFVKITADWRQGDNYLLNADSPAVDTGIAIPADWPDPLRASDHGKPDVGAFPLGGSLFQVGPRERLVSDH